MRLLNRSREAKADPQEDAALPSQETAADLSLEAGAKRRDKALEDILLEAGLVAHEHLERARNTMRQEGCQLSSALINDGVVSPRELAAVQALHLGIPMVDLAGQEVDARALSLLPEAVARQYTALPLRFDGEALVVVMANPHDMLALQDLSVRARRPIKQVVATAAEIEEHIDIYYKATERVHAGAAGSPEAGRMTSRKLADEPVVRLLDLLIAQAIRDRASDIHIEPQEDHMRVRFRIDGVLHEVLILPLTTHLPLVSRLKIMAGMNIAERRRSQDGQFTVEVGGHKVDVRVATGYTVVGEMVSLRLLDKSFAIIDLERLGFTSEALERYQRLLRLPYGMILVSGPTGAGKTTTLYASLNRMNREERNIITIEDPVEYRFADINQIQVNAQAGITFGSQLRAILRMDPDVILVGEIRDQETALIATQAALTGHLVLSTIHANDALSALLRLKELGVEPYLVASAVTGVTAQRMVRRVCPSCRTTARRPKAEQVAYADELGEQREHFTYGAGCNVCARTGYHGRTGVFEILTITESIREGFLSGVPWSELRAEALREGMVTMRQDGMLKVREGITTPYEVMRAVVNLQ